MIIEVLLNRQFKPIVRNHRKDQRTKGNMRSRQTLVSKFNSKSSHGTVLKIEFVYILASQSIIFNLSSITFRCQKFAQWSRSRFLFQPYPHYRGIYDYSSEFAPSCFRQNVGQNTIIRTNGKYQQHSPVLYQHDTEDGERDCSPRHLKGHHCRMTAPERLSHSGYVCVRRDDEERGHSSVLCRRSMICLFDKSPYRYNGPDCCAVCTVQPFTNNFFMGYMTIIEIRSFELIPTTQRDSTGSQRTPQRF